MGVRLYAPNLGRFLQVDPAPGGSATAYDYCNADPVNCTDLNGTWGWSSLKKALNVVAVVASYASMIPGPIGTIAGVVSGVCYAATGNWAEAAWAFGGGRSGPGRRRSGGQGGLGRRHHRARRPHCLEAGERRIEGIPSAPRCP